MKSAEDGTICSILYDVDDTIAQVKAKCEGARKNKLKCDGRRLIYNGQTLLDEQSISDLGIEVGTQLRLEPWVVIEWADLEELEADKLSAAWKAAMISMVFGTQIRLAYCRKGIFFFFA